MIDVHCHLFNARYLPLVGVLRSRKVPKRLAEGLARAMVTVTGRDPLLDASTRAGSVRASTASRAVDKSREQLFKDIMANLSNESLDDPESAQWIDQHEPHLHDEDRRPTRAGNARAGRRGPHRQRNRNNRRSSLKKWIGVATEVIDTAEAAINFLADLARPETLMVQRLLKASPGVHTFVHLMMDMEYAYNDHPDIDFLDQIDRMARLAGQSPVNIIGFVAFETFRPDGLELVRYAIEKKDFRGVKYYPSSGYLPVGNTDRMIPDHLARAGLTGREMDRLNLEMFDYCLQYDIPILTHCTPGGMDRIPGKSGHLADPKHWIRFLEEYPRFQKLRLCLAHGGGEAGWLEDVDPSQGMTFFHDVVHMVQRYDRVYTDLSHLGGVMEPAKAMYFKKALESLIDRYPKLSHRLMYGTDYPMPMDGAGWKGYLPAWMAALTDFPQELQHDFFEGNATRYLGLP
ncbi:MAG TPA: amidohydrolase family protein [Kiritimatiellia bacterium]|nr:amidohydrolase family protein [Kiritimatiellia bacterium]HMO51443.1 amidohydrolase family protein [Kiritimatiellia bacterium]HMO97868.1 amidohydrolase family protein [Kiritimatiellia bacterium]HMP97300.1 amidohydrolase family protein [Kiritimatiellia bacterium]